MYLFILTFNFVILDDLDSLNAEEKAFVEDPANEDFFDPPSVEKRSREDSPSVTGVAKKMKTSTDEVSRRVKFVSVTVICILCYFAFYRTRSIENCRNVNMTRWWTGRWLDDRLPNARGNGHISIYKT